MNIMVQLNSGFSPYLINTLGIAHVKYKNEATKPQKTSTNGKQYSRSWKVEV